MLCVILLAITTTILWIRVHITCTLHFPILDVQGWESVIIPTEHLGTSILHNFKELLGTVWKEQPLAR